MDEHIAGETAQLQGEEGISPAGPVEGAAQPQAVVEMVAEADESLDAGQEPAEALAVEQAEQEPVETLAVEQADQKARKAYLAERLKEAIAAVKADDYAQARQLLETVTREDPNNEQAWLWMSQVVESDERRLLCLQKILALNPDHAVAKKGVEWLMTHSPELKAAIEELTSEELQPPPPGRNWLAIVLGIVGLLAVLGTLAGAIWFLGINTASQPLTEADIIKQTQDYPAFGGDTVARRIDFYLAAARVRGDTIEVRGWRAMDRTESQGHWEVRFDFLSNGSKAGAVWWYVPQANTLTPRNGMAKYLQFNIIE
jgi:hypothetical protein